MGRQVLFGFKSAMAGTPPLKNWSVTSRVVGMDGMGWMNLNIYWQRGNDGNNAKINEAIMVAMIAMPQRSDEAMRCVLSAPGADPAFSFPWQ